MLAVASQIVLVFVVVLVLDFLAGPWGTQGCKGWSLRLRAANQIEGPVFAVDGTLEHSRRSTCRAWILEEGFRLGRGHQKVVSVRWKIGQAMKIPNVGFKIVPEWPILICQDP